MDPGVEPLKREGVAFPIPDIGLSALARIKAATLYFDSIECFSPADGDIDLVLDSSPEFRKLHRAGILNILDSRTTIIATNLDDVADFVRPMQKSMESNRQYIRNVRRAYDEITKATDSSFLAHILDRCTDDESTARSIKETRHSPLLHQLAQIARMPTDQCYRMILTVQMLSYIYNKTFNYRGVVPLCISESTQPLSDTRLFEGSDSKNREDLFCLLHLSVPYPTVSEANSIPVEKLIEFHEKYRVERRAFRNRMEAIAQRLALIEDPTMLVTVTTELGTELNDELHAHGKRIDELRVGTVLSSLGISIPSLVAIGADVIRHCDPITAGLLSALGLSFSGVHWWAKTRGTLRETTERSPLSYLLPVRRMLKRR